MWDTNIVSQIIENKLNQWSKQNIDIGTIITFDKGGVSYHPNHISVYNGVMHLYNLFINTLFFFPESIFIK